MNIKKALLILLVLIFLTALGWGGYSLIQKQTDKELNKLAQESRTSGQTGSTLQKREFKAESEAKAAQEAGFYLVTDNNQVGVGETSSLQVWVNGKNEVVDGAEFLLTFDPNLVEIGEPQLGSFFSLYPFKSVDNENGEIRVIALQDVDENNNLGEEIVAEMIVTTLQKGQVSFDFDLEKTHIAGYGGQELLKEAVPLTLKID